MNTVARKMFEKYFVGNGTFQEVIKIVPLNNPAYYLVSSVWIINEYLHLSFFCRALSYGSKNVVQSHILTCITKPSGFLDCDCKDHGSSLSPWVT